MPGWSKFTFFRIFSIFNLMHQKFVPKGGICIFSEICGKRPFQKCMSFGGGVKWSYF